MSTEDNGGLVERLRQVAKKAGGLDALASETGIARRTLGNYLSGRNEPRMSFLAAISGRYGVSLDWLITGVERAAELPPSEEHLAIDEELLGRVTDAIARLYKDERISLAPIDLGRLAGRRYAEIVAATADPAERLAMIKLMVVQLRADLHATAAAPGTGKRSA